MAVDKDKSNFWAQLVAQQNKGKWQCTECNNFNSDDRNGDKWKKCEACEAWNPNYQPTQEELDGTSNNNNNNNSIISKFKDNSSQENLFGDFSSSNNGTCSFQFQFGFGASNDNNDKIDNGNDKNDKNDNGDDKEQALDGGFTFVSNASNGSSTKNENDNDGSKWPWGRALNMTSSDQSNNTMSFGVANDNDNGFSTGWTFGSGNNNTNNNENNKNNKNEKRGNASSEEEEDDDIIDNGKFGKTKEIEKENNLLLNILSNELESQINNMNNMFESDPISQYTPYNHSHMVSEDDEERQILNEFYDSEENVDSDDSGNDRKEESQKEWNLLTNKERQIINQSTFLKNDENRRIKIKRKIRKTRQHRKLRCKGINEMKDVFAENKTEESDAILVTGDGGMSGILGRGTNEVSSYYPIPILSLLNENKNGVLFKQVTTGNMAAAAVTMDDEIYVWGCNDHCQLSINPLTMPDLGDEDNERSNDDISNEMKNYYNNLWNEMYDIIDATKKDKINAWLEKYCQASSNWETVINACHNFTKRIFDKYRNDENLFGQLSKLFDPDNVWQPRTQLTQSEKLERDKEKLYPYNKLMEKSGMNSKDDDDNNSDASDFDVENFQTMRLSPDNTNDKKTKNNSNNNSDSNNIDSGNNNSSKSESFSNSDYFNFFYDHSRGIENEQSFQSQLVCNYLTPAKMRLPQKFVIKKVSMGASHLNVLTTLGTVYSCGTFSNDSVVGHHFDEKLNCVVRFQRRLAPIEFPNTGAGRVAITHSRTSNIGYKRKARIPNMLKKQSSQTPRKRSSIKDNNKNINNNMENSNDEDESSNANNLESTMSSPAVTKKRGRFSMNANNTHGSYSNVGGGGGTTGYPLIEDISSGVNHFLMLDNRGCMWEMGVSKLGQRTAERLMKKYLLPLRVGVVYSKSGKKVKFQSIACGAHHNLAISKENQLYAWGQNNYCQCGQPVSRNGYNNVIDQPKLVQFYETPKDIKDIHCDNNEMNVLTENVKIESVYGGTHFSVCLDSEHRVWTFGRNASVQLGRETYREPSNDPNIETTELSCDLARQVKCLNGKIDWISSGAKFWFAHNMMNGHLYAYGDSGDGCCGVGYWRSARGRCVFDKLNVDLDKYEVIGACGGDNHSIFTLHKKNNESNNSNNSNNNNKKNENSKKSGLMQTRTIATTENVSSKEEYLPKMRSTRIVNDCINLEWNGMNDFHFVNDKINEETNEMDNDDDASKARSTHKEKGKRKSFRQGSAVKESPHRTGIASSRKRKRRLSEIPNNAIIDFDKENENDNENENSNEKCNDNNKDNWYDNNENDQRFDNNDNNNDNKHDNKNDKKRKKQKEKIMEIDETEQEPPTKKSRMSAAASNVNTSNNMR